MTEAKLKRAKDLAARRALEVYGEVLQDELEKAGLPLGDLNGTAHIHVALMLHEGEAIAVRAQWTFHTNPAIVGELLAKAKKEGVG